MYIYFYFVVRVIYFKLFVAIEILQWGKYSKSGAYSIFYFVPANYWYQVHNSITNQL